MKRIKWLMLLCAFAVMFAVPACGETYVNSSADLIAAIKNPNSGDITLSVDIKLTSKDGAIEISRDVSIDLNGFNITAENTRAIHIKSGDVTIYGEGVISATSADGGAGKKAGKNNKSEDIFPNSSSVIRVGNHENTDISKTSAKLTIEKDVTVSSDFCYGVSVFGSNDIDNSKDTANIEFVLNGTVSVTGEVPAVSGNGSSYLSATIITINGTAKSANTTAIYHPGSGTLTINGTVEGTGGIEAKGGDTNIDSNVNLGKNATITASAKSFTHGVNNNGTSTEGFAITAVNNPKYKGNVKFNISNGAVIDGYILAISDDKKSFDIPAASADNLRNLISNDLTLYPNLIHITGGVFSRNPKTFEAVSPDVSEDVIYVSSDYIVIPLSNDKYNYGVVASADFKVALSIDVNGVDSQDYKAVYSKDQTITLTAKPVSPDLLGSFDIGYTYKWTKSEDATVSADTKVFVLDGVSADSGTYKCVVTLSLDDKVLSADATVTITITDPEKEASNSGDDEAITLSADSTDVTVYQGGSIDITVTATSGDNIAWSNSGTLPSGDFTVTSASKTYTIKGTVATSADAKTYTYKVIASNDTNVASVDIKITVKAKEAEKETETTEYKLSVTVSPKELSLNRGATSGNTLTATATISPDAKVTPTLQWYSNTTASNSGGTAISSATSATYAAPTSTTGTFYYFVVAKATVSGTALTASSDVVTVTISSSSSSEETDSGDTTPDYAHMSADKVAELAVDEDGTISQDIVDALLETLTSSDGSYALTDVAASEQLVAIYAASAKAQEGVVNLSTLPLNSLSGIGTLLNNIATANNTNTSEMTLDLAGQSSSLTKVDGLSGVSLKGLSLKGNVNIAEVDLKGATVEKVEMSNSGVATLALDSTSDVKEIDANGSALATIDLASNDKIQSLDIGGTQVSTLNASGCSSLANLAAEGGSSTGTPGDLKELNIEGCESLTNLSVSNNQLLGIKKPSTLKNRVAVSARGQRRPNARFTSSSFNFWNFLWTLLGNTGSYSATTATFNVTKITTITYTVGTTTTSADVPASGDLSFSGTPTGISYEYDTSDFGPSTTSSLQSASVVAADDSGMDVTLGTVGSSSGGGSGEVTLGSSGGGCDAGFGLEALSAVMLMFALKKKRS